ncbi:MAG: hypothetical protein AAB553_00165 [Patescibacteria group bacterium]
MKKRKTKHLVFITSALVLGIGIIGTSILFTNKQTSTPFKAYPTAKPTQFITIPTPDAAIDTWQTFTDETLRYSMKYPEDIMIDERQTSEGRITVFIFAEDSKKKLPGKVTALYLANTNKKGIDGFSAFRKSDCGSNCKTYPDKTDWVIINNGYGIRNPLPKDIHNYYLTDKNERGNVLNVYVGGYINEKDVSVTKKIETFEQMIQTITFSR